MMATDSTREHKIVLFDVDGTLTLPRQRANDDTLVFLSELRRNIWTGMVGGSDLVKQREQLGEDVLNMFDFVFPENGLAAYRDGVQIGEETFKEFLGEERLKKFINFTLKYLAEIDIPVKRGTFIEFRSGMLNISPIGRNCSREERNEFEMYDKEHNIRSTMVETLKKEFPDYGLQYSIGGQISFDVFPIGWDKTYCLNHLREMQFDEIHFFGDKTSPGGNDYEIYTSKEVIGHHTNGPEETVRTCKELFMSNQ